MCPAGTEGQGYSFPNMLGFPNTCSSESRPPGNPGVAGGGHLGKGGGSVPGPQNLGKWWRKGQDSTHLRSEARRRRRRVEGAALDRSRGPCRASQAWVRRSRPGSTVGAYTPPGLGGRAASRQAAARPWAGGAGSTPGQTPPVQRGSMGPRSEISGLLPIPRGHQQSARPALCPVHNLIPSPSRLL